MMNAIEDQINYDCLVGGMVKSENRFERNRGRRDVR